MKMKHIDWTIVGIVSALLLWVVIDIISTLRWDQLFD